MLWNNNGVGVIDVETVLRDEGCRGTVLLMAAENAGRGQALGICITGLVRGGIESHG